MKKKIGWKDVKCAELGAVPVGYEYVVDGDAKIVELRRVRE